jgi:hypothetical protein
MDRRKQTKQKMEKKYRNRRWHMERDGWEEGRLDGWTDGRTEGQTDI